MKGKPDIDRIAKLACIELSAEEKKALADDMGAIIGYMDKLAAVDTEGVRPLEHVLDLCNVLRDDASAPSMPRGQLLGCAPRSQDGFYKVPLAVEK